MNKRPRIILVPLLLLALAVGAWEGRRIGDLRESELFYRWILAEAVQYRIFSQQSQPSTEPNAPQMMDKELFDKIVAASEDLLPGADERDDQGQVVKKLVALAKDDTQDWRIWDLARGRELGDLRKEFLMYLRQNRLATVASQFDPSAAYSGEGAGVSLSNIFFGFRKLAANFVWLQVDKYWHAGMMHRMQPLMMLCVKLDPNFVDAYLLGAWHLAYNATAKLPDTPEPLKKFYPRYNARLGEKELYYYYAIDFLKDGIRKNPRNYKLYFELGFSIYKEKLKDYANAVKYLSEAIRYKHDRWVPRQLYICMELNGQYEDAKAGWEHYLNQNRGNAIEEEKARRFITRNEGLIYERDADKMMERAKAVQDPAEAEKARAEGERLRGESLKLWASTAGPGGELDSFAVGRIMRMKAVKLIEEERYLEAIAVLQNAWSKSGYVADEALQMILDTKIKAGLPLSVSEKKAVMRREEAEKYKQMTPR